MSFFGRWFGSAAHAHYRRAMRAYDAGDHEAALAGFRLALSCGAPPGDPILHLAAFYAAEAATHLGRQALEDGAPARALAWLEPALHGQAVSPALLELAAMAYLERDAWLNSLACLQALLVVDPGRTTAHLLAAVVCQARGDAAAARAHVDAVRAQAPTVVLSPLLRRLLSTRTQQSVEVAALLRDFVPSPQSSSV